jgi:hypothetical protein
MARRQKEERRAGIASRGIVRRLSHFSSRVRHRDIPDAIGYLISATTRGSVVDVCSDAPARAQRLSTRRMAVLCTFRGPSLCCHMPHELMRIAWLDLIPIIPATACRQRIYVKRYSRYICSGLHL